MGASVFMRRSVMSVEFRRLIHGVNPFPARSDTARCSAAEGALVARGRSASPGTVVAGSKWSAAAAAENLTVSERAGKGFTP